MPKRQMTKRRTKALTDVETRMPIPHLCIVTGIVCILLAAPLLWSFPDIPNLNLPLWRMPILPHSIMLILLCILVWWRPNAVSHSRAWSNLKKTDWAVVALLSFIALNAFATIDSIYLHASLRMMLCISGFAIMFYIARAMARTLIFAWVLIIAVVIGGYVQGLIGLREYIATATAGEVQWRTFGTFYNPNILAGYLTLCLFTTAALAPVARRPLLKLALALFVVLLLLVLGTTGSKGGFLAMMLSAFVFVWLIATFIPETFGAKPSQHQLTPASQPARALTQSIAHSFARMTRWALLIMPMLMLLAIAMAIILLPPIRTRFAQTFAQQAHSWLFRWFVWKATLNIATAFPINGSGPGTFHLIYPRFTEVGPTHTAHNSFIQIAAESGWLSLLALLAFVVLTFHQVLRKLPHTALTARWFAVGAMASCIAFLAHNIVDYTWYVPATQLTFAFLLGWMLGCVEGAQQVDAHKRTNSKSNERCAAVHTKRKLTSYNRRMVQSHIIKWLVTALACVGIAICISQCAGVIFATRARSALSIDWALTDWHRAVSFDPLNARYRIALANVYLSYEFADAPHERAMDALRQVQTAIRLQPTRAANYHTLARTYITLRKFKRAVRAYQRALYWNPHDTLAMCDLAVLYERMGERDKARQLYERVIALQDAPYGRYHAIDVPVDMNIVRACVQLSRYLLRMPKRNITDVQKHLKTAIAIGERFLKFMQPALVELSPTAIWERNEVTHWVAKAYAMLAVIDEARGKYKSANANWDKALQLDSSIDPEALREEWKGYGKDGQ